MRHPHLLGQTLPCPKCKHLIAIPEHPPGSPESGPIVAAPPPIVAPPAPVGSSTDGPAQSGTDRPVDGNKPTPEAARPNASVDSAALTKADYGDWDEVLANIPQNPFDERLDNVPWDQAPADWGIENPEGTDLHTESQPQESQSYASAGPYTVPSLATQPVTSLPGGESNAGAENAKRRQLLLVASIGVGSSLAAALVFLLFLWWVGDSGKTAQLPPPANDSGATSPPDDHDAHSMDDSGVGQSETGPRTSDSSEQGAPQEEPTDAAGMEDANFGVDDEEDAADGSPRSTDGTSDPAGDGSKYVEEGIATLPPAFDPGNGLTDFLHTPDPPSPGTGAPYGQSDAGTRGDLSGLENRPPDGEQGDLEMERSILDESESAPVEDLSDESKLETEKLPDIFGPMGFGALLTPQMNMDDGSFSGRVPLDELDLEKLQEPEIILAHPDPQPVPPWDEQATAYVIPRWRAQSITLAQCIEHFSKLTGIGITLDWPELRAAGMDEGHLVSHDAQNKTPDALLQDILRESNLRLEFPPDGLPFVRPSGIEKTVKLSDTAIAPSSVSGSGSSLWKLPELLGGSPADNAAGSAELDYAAIAEQLVELWGFDSQPVASADGIQWGEGATLLEKASMWTTLVHLQRLLDEENENGDSKGQPGRIGVDWPEDSPQPKLLFDPEAWKASQGVLSRTVDSDILIPELRSVAEILSIAAKETKTRLIIDWQQVWQHGLVPGQSEISYLRKRTLPQIARRFKDEYALELLLIGENEVLLTTPEAWRARYLVLPLRLQGEMTEEELRRSLYMLAPVGPDGRTKFRVVKVAGFEDLYLARLTLPNIENLDDFELGTVMGWSKLVHSDSPSK